MAVGKYRAPLGCLIVRHEQIINQASFGLSNVATSGTGDTTIIEVVHQNYLLRSVFEIFMFI